MNDTYINYIDQLLDLAERNNIFCLTSRAFNEFASEVRETMAKGKPMKLEIDGEFDLLCAGCKSVLDFKGYDGDYCPYCGQKIDWGDGE